MQTTKTLPPSVNFHLWQPCNMGCLYCFARFLDVKRDEVPKGHLPKEQAIQITELLAEHFEKVTFVGGEPTLCPWLKELIKIVHDYGKTTMIVTNGSRVNEQFFEDYQGILDWVTLSLDSGVAETMIRLGRALRRGVISTQDYLNIGKKIKESEMRLKINTVVTSLNHQEDLSDLIQSLGPERWKLFQVLPILGQNDGEVGPLLCSKKQFSEFVQRHQHLQSKGIQVIPEDNNAMTGSYAMVDPAGRFFDNAKGKHNYSHPILSVGLQKAWQGIHFDQEVFQSRGGVYEWKSQSK